MKRFSVTLYTTVILAATTLVSQAALAVLPSVPVSTTPVVPVSTTSNASQLQTRITAALVSLDDQGKEMLAPLQPQARLASGNVVEYHGYVTNTAADRVRKMKVTFAIPANMELVSGSVMPSLAYGSNDGQTYLYMPIKGNINGVIQDMPMSYYKSLQWDVVGLGVNEVAEFKFRAKVK